MMGMDSFNQTQEHFMRSAPITVNMAGFKSTTTILQNAGWQISVENFRRYDRASIDMRVAFKHDGIQQMALGILEFDEQFVRSSNFMVELKEYWKFAEIHISYIAPSIKLKILPMQGLPSFSAIDARPEMVSMKEIKLEDIAMFKKIQNENFEVYINQKDEAEILEMILKKQDIRQGEIRQNMKRRRFLDRNETGLITNLDDKINTDIKHQLIICA